MPSGTTALMEFEYPYSATRVGIEPGGRAQHPHPNLGGSQVRDGFDELVVQRLELVLRRRSVSTASGHGVSPARGHGVDGSGGERGAAADGVRPAEVATAAQVAGVDLGHGDQVDAAVVAGGGVEDAVGREQDLGRVTA